jgi:hypothetical protein
LINLKKSTNDHIKYLVFHLRDADRAELKALGIKSPSKEFKRAITQGPTYTACLHDKPMAIFGTVPIQEGFGSIWMLGTDDIMKHPMKVLRLSKEVLRGLMEPYEMVGNMVFSENEVHVKWIKWLGFTFIRETIYGPDGNLFYEFAKIKD